MALARSEAKPQQPQPTRAERAIIGVVMLGGLLIPLVVSWRVFDTFRLVKELAFRAEAIALLAAAGLWAISRRRTWSVRWRRADIIVALAVLIWSGITVLTSTNRTISAESFATVIAAVVIYLGTRLAAQSARFLVIDVVMAACCANAVLAMLQEAHIWNPFRFAMGMTGHVTTTGLIGNPNDLGTFLLVPLIAAVVMLTVNRGMRRWIYVGVTLVLIGGLIASATRTAMGAFIVGTAVFAVSRSRLALLGIAAVAIALFGAATMPGTTLGRSFGEMVYGLQNRRYDIVFSERLPLFLSAIDMFRDHPLTGVGPGCYAFHDMPYRMALPHHYPPEWTKGWAQKAGQTHNDHLQVAAETGLPGYALMLAAMGSGLMAAWRAGRPTKAATPVRRFAHAFLPPFIAAIFVVMLAQFPLEIAAPRLMFLTFGGLAMTWIEDEGEP